MPLVNEDVTEDISYAAWIELFREPGVDEQIKGVAQGAGITPVIVYAVMGALLGHADTEDMDSPTITFCVSVNEVARVISVKDKDVRTAVDVLIDLGWFRSEGRKPSNQEHGKYWLSVPRWMSMDRQL